MILGEIKTFPTDKIVSNRSQALKILEEASEVFSAVESGETFGFVEGNNSVEHLMEECADVIMATCNLIQLFEIEDFRPFLKACEDRNKMRGRYDD